PNNLSGDEKLVVTGGQYNVDNSTERGYGEMQVEVVYAPNNVNDFMPPNIVAAQAVEYGNALHFSAEVNDEESGVVRVLATYNQDNTDASNGTWQSVELTFDSNTGLWVGSVGGLDAATEFFIQALDGAGNVHVFTDKGTMSGTPPASFTNLTNDPHTFFVTTWKDLGDGAGMVLADNEYPLLSLEDRNGSTAQLITETCVSGTVSGQCSITFTSPTPGMVVVHAEVTMDVLGVSEYRTDSANKLFVGGSLTITPDEFTRFVNETHTFTVQVLADEGNGAGAVPVEGATPLVTFPNGAPSVVDTSDCDNGTDANGICYVTVISYEPGLFIALATLDLNVAGLTVPLQDSASVTYIELKKGGQITPTNAECTNFLDGSAEDLNEATFKVQNGLINSTAPGVFFYYSFVAAPSADFTIDIVQTNRPPMGFPYFDVHENIQQIHVYNMDCSDATVTIDKSYENGQVTIHITGAGTGQGFIVRVKYTTHTVLGVPDPNQMIHYDFTTMIGDEIVAFDSNGLDLRKK
ncbi:MAG TPA: hypothetical protein PK530_08780, partial [Anaerolineales bacterium]|nr:hypothetical protein [Anaerolineales bacterium]